MKLYRGIKSSEFKHFTDDTATELEQTWSSILKLRSQGKLEYPKHLDPEISRAEKLIRLQRQNFTDRREIALDYAKTYGGALIEIDVPLADILKYFRIEFQNFGKRKSRFEVVYVVDAKPLKKFKRKWKLKSRVLSSGQSGVSA